MSGFHDPAMFGELYVEPTSNKRKRTSSKKKKRSHKKIKLNALLDQKFQPLFPCTHCDEQFETVDELFGHNKTHPNPNICPQCKKEETDPKLFAAHVWTHMGVRPFRCPQPECGFRTTVQSKLDQHRKLTQHSGQFGLRCPHCPRCLASTVQLYSHIRTHSAGYTCPYCHVIHKNPANFTQHVRKHTNEKPYRCVCGYRAVSKGLLKSHALKCGQVDCSEYTKQPRRAKKRQRNGFDEFTNPPPGRKRGRVSDKRAQADKFKRYPMGGHQPPPLPPPHANGAWSHAQRFDSLWIPSGQRLPPLPQRGIPPTPNGHISSEARSAGLTNNETTFLETNISQSQEISLRHALSSGLLDNPGKLEKVSIYIGLDVKVIGIWRKRELAKNGNRNTFHSNNQGPFPHPPAMDLPSLPPTSDLSRIPNFALA